MHDPWHKLVPPAMGFFGSVLMMSYLGQMPVRLWAVALAAGAVTPYFGVEFVMQYLTHTFGWISRDHSMGLAGLIGFVMGLCAIHGIGALATLGKRFSENPTSFLK